MTGSNNSRIIKSALLLICTLAVSPMSSLAQAPTTESLGKVDFGATCDASVRDDFNRAAALLHHMTYPIARAVFQSVTEEDPACSLAYWGMAMTLFQPLWPTRPGDADLSQGWELIQEARRQGPANLREEMFVATGEAFFDPAGAPDYWIRIDRWAAATTALFEAFPEDIEAKAFFALAHLATGSRLGTPADHQARAGAVLLEVLAEEPNHPGAVHYTIHANDYVGRENESLDVVRRYGEIAPRNPHALHMPTHIFVRLGAWEEVIEWNQRAGEAALAQKVGPNEEFVWDEYPHAVGYLVYAYLQRGDDAAAGEIIEALNEIPNIEPGFKTAFHLATTAARFALERQDWRTAAALEIQSESPVEWEQFPWPLAVTWYARGLGAAHLGDGAKERVAESVVWLGFLSEQAMAAGEAPFASQIDVLTMEVSAWQAYTQGDSMEALRLMAEAVALEEATPKPPITPGAIIPARELLGDLYMSLGNPTQARHEYQALNSRTPGRLNSLLGIARSSVALGDTEMARDFYLQVLDGVAVDSERAGVLEARAYLAGGG